VLQRLLERERWQHWSNLGKDSKGVSYTTEALHGMSRVQFL
jgi:hypothetical protein